MSYLLKTTVRLGADALTLQVDDTKVNLPTGPRGSALPSEVGTFLRARYEQALIKQDSQKSVLL